MKQATKYRFAELFGTNLIKLLISSLHIKRIGYANMQEARKQNGSVIFAFWHSRLLMLSFAHKFENIHVIISQHKDGEYISRITLSLGYQTIRGSSTRGGIGALKKSLRKIRKFDLAITPDGPRGPKETVQEGILYLAYKSGKPIIPVFCDAKHKWILNSWDNFIIPKPFSPAVIKYGKPLFINTKSEIRSAGRELKRRLIDLGNRSEK